MSLSSIGLDIHTGVRTALVISLIALVFSLWFGILSIRRARKLPFFRMRREIMLRGWRLLAWTVLWAILALLLNTKAEPFIYGFYPPTATSTPHFHPHPFTHHLAYADHYASPNHHPHSRRIEYAHRLNHARHAVGG